jgi:hypothetical protein
MPTTVTGCATLGIAFVTTVSKAGPGSTPFQAAAANEVADHPAVGSSGKKMIRSPTRLRS